MKNEDLAQISTEFYLQILNDRATLIEIIRKRELLIKIIKQALIQLDPHRLGMAITLAQCMPPGKNGKIRSLRERMGQGSYPWDSDLENLSIFLANESLAGYVAQNQLPSSIEDLSKETLLPAYQTEDEISAAAAPIMLEGKIAGCLLASSVEIGHFTQQRLSLLASFSDLVSLALDPDEFYPRETIQLGVLRYNHATEQRAILRAYPRLVQNKLVESYQTSHPLTYLEAEEIVWGELENQVLLG
jgi:GAF domain-containing protein